MINSFQHNGFHTHGAGRMMSPFGAFGMANNNGMWAVGMMQMMQMLMSMMGGEMPGAVIMPGTTLMPGANPMFGHAGPCGTNGMQDFLGGGFPSGGYPAMNGNGCGIYSPWTMGLPHNGNFVGGGNIGGGGPARNSGPSKSVSPREISSQANPGTEAMFRRADTMIGMHGERDRDELKKVTGRLDPAKHAWCAAFAMNMLEQHGVLSLDGLKNRNYCPTIEKWARDKGIYGTPDKYTPKPGDAIQFDWQGKRGGADHIGIVEKVENGRVYTIEGNAGNKVKRRSYKLDDPRIDGYVVTPSKS